MIHSLPHGLVHLTHRRGMAIPIVLGLALAMAILGAFVINTNKETYRQNITGLAALQAHFVARAGMEHAMVKVKYLERELYDAACLAQGRNPLFDFTRPLHPLYNPGPAFLFYSSQSGAVGLVGSFAASMGSLPGCTTVPGAWVDEFRADMNSGANISGTNVNMVLTMSPLPNDVRSRMREPFNAQYQVTSLNVLANTRNEAANQVTNRVIVDINVESTLTTARGQLFDHNLQKTIRIQRDRR
ncbi:MAG TPA: hypothetical protein PKO06_05105 [Candidatus Ozemobacteraceae bacterium]|nr:hypothetical protein [Candidatus Ozemobacteraceae bacterium]